MSADNRRDARKRHAHPIGNKADSKVVQAAAAGNSVAEIVSRHRPGQMIGDPRATRQPRFLDMPSQSYHDMLNQVTDVQTSFASLPARLKGKFGNSPYQLMRWLEVKENRPEALKLGLVIPTDEEAAELAREAAKARRGEQVDLIKEAMKPDPEAQPSYKASAQGGTK